MPVFAGGLGRIAIGRVIHIGRRVVETDRHVLAMARLGKLAHDVFAVGRVRDFVTGVGRIEHAEAVVVFGGEDHIALAGRFGERDPGIRIEFHRIELRRKRPVLHLRNGELFRGTHDGPGCLNAGD